MSYNCVGASDVSLCKRLKLTGVSKIGPVRQQRLYTFEYNSTNLPPRDSNAIDHWGYFNSNTYFSKLAGVTLNTASSCGIITLPGADRGVDTIKTKAASLAKVYLPPGGYTEYVYSAHRYSDDGVTEKYAGGVRIRQMNNVQTVRTVLLRIFIIPLQEPVLVAGN